MPNNLSNSQKNAGKVAAVSDISNVVLSVVSTIASVSDDRKRAIFQQNLQILSNDQQIELSKALNNANNESERLKILGLALTDMSKQRINNLQEVIAQQEKNKRTQLITNSIKVGALIIVGGIVVYLVAKKS
jgi:hypothetical protein